MRNVCEEWYFGFDQFNVSCMNHDLRHGEIFSGQSQNVCWAAFKNKNMNEVIFILTLHEFFRLQHQFIISFKPLTSADSRKHT